METFYGCYVLCITVCCTFSSAPTPTYSSGIMHCCFLKAGRFEFGFVSFSLPTWTWTIYTSHKSKQEKKKCFFFCSSSEWILSRRETQASVWQWVSVLHQHSLWHASPIIIPTICNRTWQTWSCFAYEKRWQTRWRDLVRRLWRRSDEAWFNYTE